MRGGRLTSSVSQGLGLGDRAESRPFWTPPCSWRQGAVLCTGCGMGGYNTPHSEDVEWSLWGEGPRLDPTLCSVP